MPWAPEMGRRRWPGPPEPRADPSPRPGQRLRRTAQGRARGGGPAPPAGRVPPAWPLVFAVDPSSWPRCDAETSPEREQDHHPSGQSNGQPVVAGWHDSWITELNWARNSWPAPADVQRVRPRDDTGRVTARQVQALVGRLGGAGPVPLCVFDAGYDPIALTVDLAAVRAQVGVRVGGSRPRRGSGRGGPTRHRPVAPGVPRGGGWGGSAKGRQRDGHGGDLGSPGPGPRRPRAGGGGVEAGACALGSHWHRSPTPRRGPTTPPAPPRSHRRASPAVCSSGPSPPSGARSGQVAGWVPTGIPTSRPRPS